MDQDTPAPAPPPTRHAHIDEFAAYSRNSNTHPEDQIELLARVIASYGWTNPIVKHSAMGIAAGHGRILAAKLIYSRGVQVDLGDGAGPRIVNRIRLADTGFELPEGHVPYIDVSHWSEAQVRAYVMLDNQVGRLSKNDPGMLHSEFELLKDEEPLLLDAFGELAPLEEKEGPTLPEVTPVTDEFWFTLSGPLAKQADALLVVRQVMGLWPQFVLTQGVTRHG